MPLCPWELFTPPLLLGTSAKASVVSRCHGIGIIDDDVIERNPVLAEKLYEVQYCDIMAQDTKYLKDRVDYLTTTNYKLKKRRSRLYKKR